MNICPTTENANKYPIPDIKAIKAAIPYIFLNLNSTVNEKVKYDNS